jgi:hypothetical protein
MYFILKKRNKKEFCLENEIKRLEGLLWLTSSIAFLFLLFAIATILRFNL